MPLGTEGSYHYMPGVRYFRKIIQIKAEDSPNVKFALALKDRGLEPPINRVIVPGVLPYADYVKRRATWDPVRQCIGLDATFYEGGEVLLYPPAWLNLCEAYAETLPNFNRKGLGLGIDPGEGTDDTAWCVIDELGILELVAHKTPDTSIIEKITLQLMQKWSISSTRVLFDRGGGGKQIVDYMRHKGFMVQSVSFGESILPKIKRGIAQYSEKVDVREERYAYKNRRSEMYGKFRLRIDPTAPEHRAFAISREYTELRRQLSVMPLLYDEEGRIMMLPKNKKKAESKEKTLREILGCSPDQADALVLAYRAMTTAPKIVYGVAF